MKDVREDLEPAELRNLDGPDRAHAAEIVTKHIHDHHVLGAVLRAGEELGTEALIFGGIRMPRPRSLDRPRFDAAPTPHEEALGTRRGDGVVAAAEIGGMRRRRVADQRFEQSARGAFGLP